MLPQFHFVWGKLLCNTWYFRHVTCKHLNLIFLLINFFFLIYFISKFFSLILFDILLYFPFIPLCMVLRRYFSVCIINWTDSVKEITRVSFQLPMENEGRWITKFDAATFRSISITFNLWRNFIISRECVKFNYMIHFIILFLFSLSDVFLW